MSAQIICYSSFARVKRNSLNQNKSHYSVDIYTDFMDLHIFDIEAVSVEKVIKKASELIYINKIKNVRCLAVYNMPKKLRTMHDAAIQTYFPYTQDLPAASGEAYE